MAMHHAKSEKPNPEDLDFEIANNVFRRQPRALKLGTEHCMNLTDQMRLYSVDKSAQPNTQCCSGSN